MMKALLWIFAVVCSTTAYAGQVTVPNTFTAGTKAKAADVNANFTALEQAVNDNDTRITQNTTDTYSNTTAIGTLNGQVAGNSSAIQTNAAAITTLTSDTYSNTTAIGTLNGQVAGNSSAIQTNAAAILGNAGNISNNATNITTNINAINTNSSAIAALQQSVPTTYQVVDAYGTVLGDLIGADMFNVTFLSSQGYMSQAGREQLVSVGISPALIPGGSFSVDYYASVDCTGTPFPTQNLTFSYMPGQLLYSFSTQSYVYVPLNATLTTYTYASVAQTYPTFDPYGAPITQTSCQPVVTSFDPYTGLPLSYGTASISGYMFLPNDPAVTGVPNTIGFPVSIQKK